MIIDKGYSDITALIDANSFYYDYEDTINIRERVIYVQRNSNVSYRCPIKYLVSGDTGYSTSNCKDFDDNYKTGAGSKKYMMLGKAYTATKNSTTNHDLIMIDEAATPNNIIGFIYKGSIETNDKAKFGDSVTIQAIDIDNVLGYGANFVLGTMVKNRYLKEGVNSIIIQPSSYDYRHATKKIPKDVYLRVKYASIGTVDDVALHVTAEYEY